ncbi:MAG: endonuclease, partial [Bacteroidales bacterium]|nr:endonuclease [Bacteroidales bacterium]
MKRLVFALLTLLVFSSPVEAKRKIRVLYWNVQNGMWADQDKNYDNFVRFVQELNPDVCVWCEAESRYKDNVRDKIEGRHEAYLPYNWDMLARRYGHEYAYIAGKRDDFPQIITSKVPVRIVKRINGEKDGIQVVHGSGLASMPLGRGRDSLYIITVHTYPFKYSYGAEDQKKSAA